MTINRRTSQINAAYHLKVARGWFTISRKYVTNRDQIIWHNLLMWAWFDQLGDET